MQIMSCDIDIDKIEKWMDSPEGQESIKKFWEERDRDENVMKRFFERVKAMSVKEQDKWMGAIISKYESKPYKDRWYNRGIFPPMSLYYYISAFMYEYGKVVGYTDDGEEIYQYNHWCMDCKYGQGQCHYNFVYSVDETPTNTYVGSDKYWENIFETETNRDKGLHNAFAELHDRLVNQVIAFCKEHNLEVDEFTIGADGILGSKDVGEWTSATDSYMSMYVRSEDGGIDREKPFLYRI